jgi:hypothetical protein
VKKYNARVGHSYTARPPEDWRGCSGRPRLFSDSATAADTSNATHLASTQLGPTTRSSSTSPPEAGEHSHLRDHDGKSAAKGAKKREGNGTRACWASAAPE